MRKLIAPLLLLLLAVVVFRNWFLPSVISAFDFPYFSKLMMQGASFAQYAWGYHPGLGGFEQFLSPYSWVFPLIYFPQVILQGFGFDWSQIVRIVYLFPILIFAIVSPIIFFRKILPDNKFYLISVLIYSFNTFVLLLFSGQVYLSISYVLFPVIFYLFYELLNSTKQNLFKPVLLGGTLSVSVMADPRLTYIAIIALIFYLIFFLFQYNVFKNSKMLVLLLLYSIALPAVIVVLLQCFWLIPTILYGVNPVDKLGSAFSNIQAVNYFSFAKFENSIALLHPNWPENIFGKVGFMKSEFLIVPILAFASLLFIPKIKNQKTKINILFFAFLGLVGAFLAKGSNEPFGGVYIWLFNYFPGFVMFRDASKWYLLVVISYSILIPFSVWKIYEWLKSHDKFSISNFQFSFKNKLFNCQNFFLILTCFYLMLLIRPAILGQLGGTLKTTTVPREYVALEKYLIGQPDFFRTLWFPVKQRFGFYSNTHPQISANSLFSKYNYSQILESLRINNNLVNEASIKYVIVPFDSQGEIFLTDRKYDSRKYDKAIKDISKISWLKRIDCCSRIAVFESSNYKDHFWSPDEKLKINYKFINPTKYEVSVKNAKKRELIVFSESFDSKWEARSTSIKYRVESRKYNDKFNSFILPKDGSYSFEVYYKPQDWVNIGAIVSVSSLILVLLALIFGSKLKKW